VSSILKNENIPSVQVKNKPRVRGSEHVFILGSMGSTVAKTYVMHLWGIQRTSLLPCF
jgi:hypothetical protein